MFGSRGDAAEWGDYPSSQVAGDKMDLMWPLDVFHPRATGKTRADARRFPLVIDEGKLASARHFLAASDEWESSRPLAALR